MKGASKAHNMHHYIIYIKSENKIKSYDFFMEKTYVAKVKNMQKNTHQFQVVG